MQHNHTRKIKLNKTKLIEAIETNKNNHVKEYNEAVENYKIEAKKQLKQALKGLEDGELQIRLSLTVPINRSDEYDKVKSMFEWELSEEVELSQAEFMEYVQDDNASSHSAKFANTFYSSSARSKSI